MGTKPRTCKSDENPNQQCVTDTAAGDSGVALFEFQVRFVLNSHASESLKTENDFTKLPPVSIHNK